MGLLPMTQDNVFRGFINDSTLSSSIVLTTGDVANDSVMTSGYHTLLVQNSLTTVGPGFDILQHKLDLDDHGGDIEIGTLLGNYIIAGVTLFFLILCSWVIRCCIKRRDRIRRAYDGYNSGETLSAITWRSTFRPTVESLPSIENQPDSNLPFMNEIEANTANLMNLVDLDISLPSSSPVQVDLDMDISLPSPSPLQVDLDTPSPATRIKCLHQTHSSRVSNGI